MLVFKLKSRNHHVLLSIFAWRIVKNYHYKKENGIIKDANASISSISFRNFPASCDAMGTDLPKPSNIFLILFAL